MVRFKVGAESVAGDQQDARVPKRVPGRVAHAVDVETGDVLCGRSCAGLADFSDTDFESAGLFEKCPACEAVVVGLAP